MEEKELKYIRVMAPLHVREYIGNGNIHTMEHAWDSFENQLRVLRDMGVHAVSVDVWWGQVEQEGPGFYDWSYYDQMIEKLNKHGFQWVPILSFHQCGGNIGDSYHQPIPLWIWGELLHRVKGATHIRDFQYISETGASCQEYVSLFSDEYVMPYYERFMRAFADHFHFHADLIDEINISLGPAGELRYPSYNAHDWGAFPNRGTLQCYSELALKQFRNAMTEKYKTLPQIAGKWKMEIQNIEDIRFPEDTDDFFENKKYCDTVYGRDFTHWYHEMLAEHGSRILKLACKVFGGEYGSIPIGFKVPGIHWKISDPQTPRAAEITAGLIQSHRGLEAKNHHEYLDMLEKIVPASLKKRLILHFTCLEKFNNDQDGFSRAEDLVNWVADDAHYARLKVSGENALADGIYNEYGWKQIHNALNREKAYAGITLLRMDHMFNAHDHVFHWFKELIRTLN
ncbi:MAG: family 14 glycosylhydrolase [Cytophagales bacterium]|nr:family 14 glycosylhydrolase [Cytophagales bacterium]